jgi:hypothetical protein
LNTIDLILIYILNKRRLSIERRYYADTEEFCEGISGYYIIEESELIASTSKRQSSPLSYSMVIFIGFL